MLEIAVNAVGVGMAWEGDPSKTQCSELEYSWEYNYE
jgi:hypothetical protein